jgi:SnoaL-like domain
LPHRFAQEWIDGANQKNFERVLALYADDVEASSPFIRLVAGEPLGRLVGKDKLRNYWTASLTKRAEICFELIEVFVGASSVALHYVNRGQRALETFCFDDRGLVASSNAHYLEPTPAGKAQCGQSLADRSSAPSQ